MIVRRKLNVRRIRPRKNRFLKIAILLPATLVGILLVALIAVSIISASAGNVKYCSTYFMGICLEDHMTRCDYRAKTKVRAAKQTALTDDEISAAQDMYAEQMIGSTVRTWGLDIEDLKISDVRFTAVRVDRFGNRVMPGVFGYIYNANSGDVLGVLEFSRADNGAVVCRRFEVAEENNGIMQAFAEHPGEDLVCVYLTDILHGSGSSCC